MKTNERYFFENSFVIFILIIKIIVSTLSEVSDNYNSKYKIESSMKYNLYKKVILITGSSGGIGFACPKILPRKGCKSSLD